MCQIPEPDPVKVCQRPITQPPSLWTQKSISPLKSPGVFLGSWRCPCGSWALLRDALRRYRGREAGELDEENFDMLARHPDHSSAVAVCVHEINSHDHVMWA